MNLDSSRLIVSVARREGNRPSLSTTRRTAGFTMVEIALCLAIIGFALVAIIGVLPTGLQVQRDNMEETIINQEGAFFLEAIRNGAQGITELTNYVEWIKIRSGNAPTATHNVITNRFGRRVVALDGRAIIGLLTTPKYIYGTPGVSNVVTAKVRSMSGSAAEKNSISINNDAVFTYLLQSEIMPYSSFPTNSSSTNFNAAGLTPAEQQARKILWTKTQILATNLHEIRLTLRWPVWPDGSAGNRAKTFRTLANGKLLSGRDRLNLSLYLYFFDPLTYGP